MQNRLSLALCGWFLWAGSYGGRQCYSLACANSLDWFAVVVATVAFIGMVKWKWDVILVVLGAGTLGLVYRLFEGK